LIAAWLLAPEFTSADDLMRVKVPDGFEAELFADDELAHDIFAMTIDSRGRVVVSGPGYVRILIDEDGDGKADRAQQFADGPATGAQGMYFHGRDLLCTGDAGLIRYRDADGDDRADGPPDLFLKLRTGGEHTAHAIRKGPDGWWYLIAGNMTDITASYATLSTSPVRLPEGGTLLRLKPDLSGGEIVAHGMRNAYDFDFSRQGAVYTFDSDDERDVSLPWYRPNRVFELLPGMHAGWVSTSWKRPDDFLDMPPVLASLGRGSPTGVVAYQHTQFPAPYRNALFVLDWTFGRVWALPLQRTGEVWETQPIDFMTAHGEYGFAPTDAEVGPDGSLYVSVGGRGTRGGVFRVRYVGDRKDPANDANDSDAAPDEVTRILDAPQPLSSWSRAIWEPLARKVGPAVFELPARDQNRSASARCRAIEVATELFGGLSSATAGELARADSPEVRARLAWSLGRIPPGDLSDETLALLLRDRDPLVRRCIYEALITQPVLLERCVPADLVQGLRDPQRFVRAAAVRAIADAGDEFFARIGEQVRQADWRAALSYAEARQLRRSTGAPALNAYAVEVGRRILEADHPLELKRDAARLVQIGLGDLGSGGRLPPAFDGYSSPLDLAPYEVELDPLRLTLAKLFPSGDEAFDRELSRLAAMVSVYSVEFLANVVNKITADSDPVEDMHYLFVAAQIPLTRANAQQVAIAQALLNLEPKIRARKMAQDTNWDDRITELYEALVERDPVLPELLIMQEDFGRPSHVLFLSRAPEELLPRAVQAFSTQVAKDPEYPWNNDVIFLFAAGNTDELRAMIRRQYDNFSVRSAVLMTLAENPDEQDRAKFIEGLDSSQLEVLAACVGALEKLKPGTDAANLVPLVRTLRRLGNDDAEYPVRDRVAQLLTAWTGQQFGYVAGDAGKRPQIEVMNAWTRWLTETYPNEASNLLGGSAEDLDSLHRLLAEVDWKSGDVDRGRELFQQRGCAQCHGGSRSLGPDLSGVAGRFSREDLFIAIALPNRDVSPRYQTTLIESAAGKVYSGLIIYESADGVTLRNSTNQTFRFEAEDIVTKRRLNTSLMPTGLLKDFTPQDAADLYRYLQTLSPPGN